MPEPRELVADLLDRLNAVPDRDSDALDGFLQRADMVLRRVFGADSGYLSRLGNISFQPMVFPAEERLLKSTWASGIAEARNLVTTALDEVTLFGAEPKIERLEHGAAASGDHNTGGSGRATVFVVHGHNEATKTTVARFLEKLKLDVVILHERASRGRTIIEKFEDESSSVDYAVVLLTDDDFAGAVNEPPTPRARQNVVLELGYFLGLLKRNNVAALVTPGVEIPGDYSGVVYISLQDESWKLELAKEMRAAGLPIDMNDAL